MSENEAHPGAKGRQGQRAAAEPAGSDPENPPGPKTGCSKDAFFAPKTLSCFAPKTLSCVEDAVLRQPLQSPHSGTPTKGLPRSSATAAGHLKGQVTNEAGDGQVKAPLWQGVGQNSPAGGAAHISAVRFTPS